MKSSFKKKLCTVVAITLVATVTLPNGFVYGRKNIQATETTLKNSTGSSVEVSGEQVYIEENIARKSKVADEVNVGKVGESTTSGNETSTTVVKVDYETSSTTTQEPTTTQVPTTTTQEPTTTAPIIPPVTSNVQPWGKNSAGQFVNGNKQVIYGATMKGIDVSHHNGVIDWAKVAASDVGYAIIRCGYGDNLKSQDDGKWEKNVAGCEKYNIPFGVYIYSYATTTKQAKSEAEHVLRLIKGHKLNFPIYYDMEDAKQAKLSKSKRTKIANTFLGIIQNAGYECGIYANLNWWNNYLDASLGNDSLWRTWVAQYNNNGCDYKKPYSMWQSSSTARVSGVNGNVDINFWFGPVRDRNYDITVKKGTAKPPVTTTAVKKPGRVTIKSVKVGKKKATVKWKKVSSVKGYKIQYSTSKKFKSSKTKSKYTTKRCITIKKLKSKKTYYFRIKAYKINSSKKKVYSSKWSKVKHKKVK